MVSETEIARIVGHEFPGGTYKVEHWENFLLTECTGGALLQNGVVHPVVLFHMPIIGSGTNIAEMFALGQAESDYSISIESYDWEMLRPILEDIEYQVSGKIISAERSQKTSERYFDRIEFCFEVRLPNADLAARTTIIWHYNRQD